MNKVSWLFWMVLALVVMNLIVCAPVANLCLGADWSGHAGQFGGITPPEWGGTVELLIERVHILCPADMPANACY
ncbi:hypothetical protein KJ596_00190 [Patescibacteria group bacterium]|nr:hypothetical protein [Patescibacteria group bacterium]MBU1868560.1 hypothetical protein [Patescibacteria group bacterium]